MSSVFTRDYPTNGGASLGNGQNQSTAEKEEKQKAQAASAATANTLYPVAANTVTDRFEAETAHVYPGLAQEKVSNPDAYRKKYMAWLTEKARVGSEKQVAEDFIAKGVQQGGKVAAETAQRNAVLSNIGTQYTDDIANILAGRNNYANAVNAQQAVVQQAALGGWSGTAGALAGQQKASQLGATDILQDRTAEAQDVFATNSALAARASQALQTQFTINEQDFKRQLGYNQQILNQANDALSYATGEQRLNIEAARAKYQDAVTQYQIAAAQDKLDDEKKMGLLKAIVGATVALASVVAAGPTGGASLVGVAAGAKIAVG